MAIQRKSIGMLTSIISIIGIMVVASSSPATRGSEDLLVGEAFSRPIVVHTSHLDHPSGSDEYWHAIASRTVRVLGDIAWQHFVGGKASTKEQHDRALQEMADFVVATSDLTEDQLRNGVEAERKFLEALPDKRRKDPELSGMSEPERRLAGVYPTTQAVEDRLRQLKEEPPAVALFRDQAEGLVRLIETAEAIGGKGAIAVTDADIATERGIYEGFLHPLGKPMLMISARFHKARALLSKALLEAIKSQQIMITDHNIREEVEAILRRRMPTGKSSP